MFLPRRPGPGVLGAPASPGTSAQPCPPIPSSASTLRPLAAFQALREFPFPFPSLSRPRTRATVSFLPGAAGSAPKQHVASPASERGRSRRGCGSSTPLRGPLAPAEHRDAAGGFLGGSVSSETRRADARRWSPGKPRWSRGREGGLAAACARFPGRTRRRDPQRRGAPPSRRALSSGSSPAPPASAERCPKGPRRRDRCAARAGASWCWSAEGPASRFTSCRRGATAPRSRNALS